jgi:hypothetical protein
MINVAHMELSIFGVDKNPCRARTTKIAKVVIKPTEVGIMSLLNGRDDLD